MQFTKTIVILAILLDAIVLTGFLWIKAKVDLPLIIVALGLMVIIFFGERENIYSIGRSDIDEDLQGQVHARQKANRLNSTRGVRL